MGLSIVAHKLLVDEVKTLVGDEQPQRFEGSQGCHNVCWMSSCTPSKSAGDPAFHSVRRDPQTILARTFLTFALNVIPLPYIYTL